MINAANVVTVDIEAGNGVIHVIDSVLIPPAGRKMVPEDEKKYQTTPFGSVCRKDPSI